MEYDVFISHASEDKYFVQPLAEELRKAGLRVWYDGFEIKLGDDIAEKITQGLLKSRYGVVILSKVFLEKKKWTEAELNALVNRQATGGKKVILPVWHKISAGELSQYNPILVGKRAVRSEDGLNIVVSQIVDACSEPDETQPSSIFQVGGKYGLREQCLEIIRQDDIIAWRKLISQVTGPIPDQLKEWKKEGEIAVNQGGKAWGNAVQHAAEICLPGFVPIFSAVEAGNIQYWKESVVILRRLALLEDEMGGGLVKALRIGIDMLQIAGFLGLSIIANLKLLNFTNEWMYLKMPGRTQGVQGEISWLDFSSLNRPPEGVNVQEPFLFLRSLAKSDLLINFFESENKTVNTILLGNLLASLIEFRESALNPTAWEVLTGDPKHSHAEVYPVWCIMKTNQFQTSTLELFGDSLSVYNYVFPKHEINIKDFWLKWKQWKQICARHWYSGMRFDFPMIEYMALPGEPVR